MSKSKWLDELAIKVRDATQRQCWATDRPDRAGRVIDLAGGRPGDSTVLDVVGCLIDEVERLNALLATAPELLEVCKRLIEYLPCYDGGQPCDTGLGTMAQARAVIAKAEGTAKGVL